MLKHRILTVLITGADHPTGLGTARDLFGQNVRLIGLCKNPNSRFCRSRVWNRIVTVPNSDSAALRTLFEVGRESPAKLVLFPTQDDLILQISDHRDELSEYYHFVLPEKRAVKMLMDKTAFHRWALDNGFPVPESHVIQSEGELLDLLNSVEFPVLLKPLFRTSEWQANSPLHKVYKLDRREEIRSIRFDLFQAVPRFLVQKWIPGGDERVHFCLMYIDRNGRELGHYTGRKLLQWPLMTGSTALGVGMENHEVYALASQVLGTAGLRGLGSLELKRSEEDNRYYITEPTVGRNNLQSRLATVGGINLSRLALFDAVGETTMRSNWRRRNALYIEEYFLLHALIVGIRRGQVKWRDVIEAIKSVKGVVVCSTFHWRDITPFAILTRNLGRALIRSSILKSKKQNSTIERRLADHEA